MEVYAARTADLIRGRKHKKGEYFIKELKYERLSSDVEHQYGKHTIELSCDVVFALIVQMWWEETLRKEAWRRFYSLS
jgi:hypothetical protein